MFARLRYAFYKADLDTLYNNPCTRADELEVLSGAEGRQLTRRREDPSLFFHGARCHLPPPEPDAEIGN